MERHNYLCKSSVFNPEVFESHMEYCVISGKDSASEAVEELETDYGDELEAFAIDIIEGGPIFVTEEIYNQILEGVLV